MREMDRRGEVQIKGDRLHAFVPARIPHEQHALLFQQSTLDFHRVDADWDEQIQQHRTLKALLSEQLSQAGNPAGIPLDEDFVESLGLDISLQGGGRLLTWETEAVDSSQAPIVFHRIPLLTNHIQGAVAEQGAYGDHLVMLTFDSTGALAFSKITAESVGQKLAIVLDGTVLSSPVVREKIEGGVAAISLQSEEQAAALAAVLNHPPLPTEVRVQETTIEEP